MNGHGRVAPFEHGEQTRDTDAPAGAGALSTRRWARERVIERCCGLDVHKQTVTACVRVPAGTTSPEPRSSAVRTKFAESARRAGTRSATSVPTSR